MPVELDNSFQDNVGYLDWEFMIEEFPVEKDDPKPKPSGDSLNITVWIILISSIVLVLLWRKKSRENN